VDVPYAGRALFLVRNSQSSRVKMSFVTAAMENRARSCVQRASMRAVFPEPTGLEISVHMFTAILVHFYNTRGLVHVAVNMPCAESAGLPSNAYRECSVHPVSVLDNWHLASKEASWAI
jgi:hypothetical protein